MQKRPACKECVKRNQRMRASSPVRLCCMRLPSCMRSAVCWRMLTDGPWLGSRDLDDILWDALLLTLLPLISNAWKETCACMRISRSLYTHSQVSFHSHISFVRCASARFSSHSCHHHLTNIMQLRPHTSVVAQGLAVGWFHNGLNGVCFRTPL